MWRIMKKWKPICHFCENFWGSGCEKFAKLGRWQKVFVDFEII